MKIGMSSISKMRLAKYRERFCFVPSDFILGLHFAPGEGDPRVRVCIRISCSAVSNRSIRIHASIVRYPSAATLDLVHPKKFPARANCQRRKKKRRSGDDDAARDHTYHQRPLPSAQEHRPSQVHQGEKRRPAPHTRLAPRIALLPSTHPSQIMLRPRLRIPSAARPRFGAPVQSPLLPLAYQTRSRHTLRPLHYENEALQNGIPDFLSPTAFKIAWTQYQTHLLEKLNNLTAGTSCLFLFPPPDLCFCWGERGVICGADADGPSDLKGADRAQKPSMSPKTSRTSCSRRRASPAWRRSSTRPA